MGGLTIELLKAGARQAVNVEISPEYEETARKLLVQEDMLKRVNRLVMDFAEEAEGLKKADHVVMHRVICCYHDMPKLMGAAADKTGHVLAVTFPRNRWYVRIGFRLGNFWLRRLKIQFQAFVHNPYEIIATASEAGLQPVYEDNDLVWRAVVFERAA